MKDRRKNRVAILIAYKGIHKSYEVMKSSLLISRRLLLMSDRASNATPK